MTKKKKKRKGKKVTVEEKIDSFFNFFKDCDPNPVGTMEDAFNATDHEAEDKKPKKKTEEEEEEKEEEETIQD